MHNGNGGPVLQLIFQQDVFKTAVNGPAGQDTNSSVSNTNVFALGRVTPLFSESIIVMTR